MGVRCVAGFSSTSRDLEVWWGATPLLRLNVTSDILRWWRLCYVHTYTTQSFTVYWNDEVFTGTIKGPKLLRGGGIFVLGQDQDILGGGFAFSESVNAIIGDFRLYTRAVTKQEAIDYTNCRPTNHDPKPHIHFIDLLRNWRMNGSVEVGVVKMSEVCQQESVLYVVFPEKRSFSQAAVFCESVGGSLAMPSTPRENQLIRSSMSPFMQQCLHPSGVLAYLGFNADTERRILTYYNTGLVAQYNILTQPYIFGFPCVGIIRPEVEGEWQFLRCEEFHCTLCAIHATSRLKVNSHVCVCVCVCVCACVRVCVCFTSVLKM